MMPLDELSQEDRILLDRALRSAFAGPAELERVTWYGLDLHLTDITTRLGPYPSIVLEVIQWCESNGRLEPLIKRAREENPGNPFLQRFAQKVGLESSSTLAQAREDTPLISPDLLQGPDKDLVRELIREAPPIVRGKAPERVAFLQKAGLDHAWIRSSTWDGPSGFVTAQLLNAATDPRRQLSTSRAGYTALGAILDQLLREVSTGQDVRRFIQATITNYNLIDVNAAELSPELRALLEIAPLPVDKEAVQRALQPQGQILDASWLSKAARVAQAVCRAEVQPAGGLLVLFTAFLVGPDLIMTVDHTMRNMIDRKLRAREGLRVKDVVFRFGYRMGDARVLPENERVYRLAPRGWLIDNSPMNELDYALLKVDGTPGLDLVGGEPRGWLEPQAHNFQPGEPLFLIQHAAERVHGQITLALDSAHVVEGSPGPARVTYMSDIDPGRARGGSSGAPCFTSDWKLVAINHARIAVDKREGIPFSAILQQPKVQSALRDPSPMP
jgi:hypothetical protein